MGIKIWIISLILLLALVGCGCGSTSSNNGGDAAHGCGDFSNDGLCDGPAVGQSPNDMDNTFRSLAVHPTDPNTIWT